MYVSGKWYQSVPRNSAASGFGGYGGIIFPGANPKPDEATTANSGACTVISRQQAIEALVAEYTGGSWADLLDRLERKHKFVLAKLS